MDFLPYDPEADIMRTRRNLPHWEQEGRTYFVTFRLADSIPQSKLDQWEEERRIWLKANPKPWTGKQASEYSREFQERIERWCDRGYRECTLRRSDAREILVSSLEHFQGQRYWLDEYVIMPNHAHILFIPIPQHRLSKILHSWKSYSSSKINQLLGRKGTLWMDERFDHIVRSMEQLERLRRYLAENPTRAGLKPEDYAYWKRPK